MDAFGGYILSVASAAVIVGVLCSLGDSKSTQGVLIRMIGGLFLAFTVIAPVADLNFDVIDDFAGEFADDGDLAASAGENLAQEAMGEFILEETQAYILDKANSYGAALSVSVTLSSGEPQVPEFVELRGGVSPYVRRQLQQIIEEDIGIPKENQSWIG